MDQALSLWFLLGWIGGDSCNLIGSFLADQLPLQVGRPLGRVGCLRQPWHRHWGSQQGRPGLQNPDPSSHLVRAPLCKESPLPCHTV